MPLIWTRAQDGEHNGKPRYEYHATSGDRSYHIVWAYDRGGTFGYTGVRKDAQGRTEYLSPFSAGPAHHGIAWSGSLKRCKEMCELIEARNAPLDGIKFSPKIAGAFHSFEEWVNTASRRIGERYCPTDTTGNVLRAICLDTQGRRCQVGGDFQRARDEGAFPVVYFWSFETNGK